MSEIEFTVRRTSSSRSWNGLEAYIYDASPGVDETHFVRHCISMHLGEPVGVTTRCDGKALHRVQVAGDIKIIPAGFSRIWEIERATRKLSIYVAPALLRMTAEECGVNADRVSITPQLHVEDPQIEHIAWALQHELESDEPLGRLYAESLGTALCAHLLRRYASLANTGGVFSAQRLRRIIDYLQDHIAEDLSLRDLAEVANVSPSHFNTLFKRSTGIPAHQYLLQRRVEYALELITTGPLPLRDVAAQAGFSSQSHMTTSVRRIAGTSPAALRRNES